MVLRTETVALLPITSFSKHRAKSIKNEIYLIMFRETLTHWLVQRTTALLLIPTILLANVSTLIWITILLFWHFHIGITEILADYVHHEVTRNVLLMLLRLLVIIVMKYAFVLFVY